MIPDWCDSRCCYSCSRILPWCCSVCSRVFPSICFICSLTVSRPFGAHSSFQVWLLLSFSPVSRYQAQYSWCGHGHGSIACWLEGTLPVFRLRLYPSAPGSLSSSGANSFTSGTVRPRGRPQTNGPLSLGHGSWFVWPDPPGSLCARSSGHRELCGELGGLGQGSKQPS